MPFYNSFFNANIIFILCMCHNLTGESLLLSTYVIISIINNAKWLSNKTLYTPDVVLEVREQQVAQKISHCPPKHGTFFHPPVVLKEGTQNTLQFGFVWLHDINQKCFCFWNVLTVLCVQDNTSQKLRYFKETLG